MAVPVGRDPEGGNAVDKCPPPGVREPGPLGPRHDDGLPLLAFRLLGEGMRQVFLVQTRQAVPPHASSSKAESRTARDLVSAAGDDRKGIGVTGTWASPRRRGKFDRSARSRPR